MGLTRDCETSGPTGVVVGVGSQSEPLSVPIVVFDTWVS